MITCCENGKASEAFCIMVQTWSCLFREDGFFLACPDKILAKLRFSDEGNRDSYAFTLNMKYCLEIKRTMCDFFAPINDDVCLIGSFKTLWCIFLVVIICGKVKSTV